MEYILLVLGFFAILAIVLLYSSLSWGLVGMKFWYWFLLPVFPALPQVTFIQCVGLMMFISLFKTMPAQVLKEEYTNKNAGYIISFLAPWLVLVVGWFVHFFITK